MHKKLFQLLGKGVDGPTLILFISLPFPWFSLIRFFVLFPNMHGKVDQLLLLYHCASSSIQLVTSLSHSIQKII